MTTSAERRKADLSLLEAAHTILEGVSEGDALTTGERKELITANLALTTLIDSLSYNPEKNQGPITEADFPEIGPFNTGELSKMLSGMTILRDAEQDYPPTDPEKVRHVDIGTGLDNLTAERGE